MSGIRVSPVFFRKTNNNSILVRINHIRISPVCQIAVLLTALSVFSSKLYVDDNNTGATTGSAASPYATLQDAIDVVSDGDTILVAGGTYNGGVEINDKGVILLGGFAGGSTSGYQASTAGDFSAQNPFVDTVHIVGDTAASGIFLIGTGATGSSIDGFHITGARHGIEFDQDETWPLIGDVTITRCILENNGLATEDYFFGGGISFSGSGHVVRGCIIRNNNAGRGGAISCGEDDSVLIDSNLISNNHAFQDHAGALNLGGIVELSRNIIENNSVEDSYGWAGGALILGHALLWGNTFRENYAPSYAGAIYVDEGAECTMRNELIYRNSAGEQGGGVGVDDGDDGDDGDPGPSHLHMINCTVANNSSPDAEGGNGLLLENGSFADVTNSIFWGNGDDFLVYPSSQITSVTYSITQATQSGTGNSKANPQFADTAAGDFRLKSQGGRWNPSANSGAGDWITDATTSPGIDAGDPGFAFNLETAANGSRVNLGFDGNTAYASRSSDASVHGGLPVQYSLNRGLSVLYNRASRSIILRYNVPQSGMVRLSILTLNGKRVVAAVNEFQHAGSHEFTLNSQMFSEFSVAGIYLCSLQAGLSGSYVVPFFVE